MHTRRPQTAPAPSSTLVTLPQVLLARTERQQARFNAQLRRREVSKEYVALVLLEPPPPPQQPQEMGVHAGPPSSPVAVSLPQRASHVPSSVVRHTQPLHSRESCSPTCRSRLEWCGCTASRCAARPPLQAIATRIARMGMV